MYTCTYFNSKYSIESFLNFKKAEMVKTLAIHPRKVECLHKDMTYIIETKIGKTKKHVITFGQGHSHML